MSHSSIPRVRMSGISALLGILTVLQAPAQAAIPALKLELIADRQFMSPVSMAVPGDGSGRLFIVEQRGQIRIFRSGAVQPVPFLDIAPKIVAEQAGFDERGLLGLAFHPGYTNPQSPGFRRFYVFYSAASPNAPGTAAAPVNCRTTVAEYLVSAGNPDAADPASERILFSFDKPQFNHNGGQIEFGPDGFLYIATGDGGSSNDNNAGHSGGSAARPTNALGNSQDRTVLLGKILRIDPLGNNGPGGQYGIPADNPFAGAAGGIRGEIYAWGLRNPWRFSFDTGPGGSGRLFCADVGQGQVEEIDIITKGGNYGWRNREGTFTPAFSADAPPPPAGVTFIDPIAQYAHPGVTIGTPALPQYGISVTGGFVYRGTEISGLAGAYLFGDYSDLSANPSGRMLGLEEGPPGTFTLSALTIEGGNPIGRFILAMGRDEAGELYVLTKQARAVTSTTPDGLPTGSLLRVRSTASAAVKVNLAASRDNTIYSDNPGSSNGAGVQLFAGAIRTGEVRRALVAFDVSSIPAGAVIQNAELVLNMDKTVVNNMTITAHRVSRDWGEGASDAPDPEGIGTEAAAPDATWNHAKSPDVSWTSAGGDFTAAASGSAVIGSSTGLYRWGGAGMAADVKAWKEGSAPNHGWLIRAAQEGINSVKRFGSRENAGAGLAPVLEVTYSAAAVPSRRQLWERAHFLIGQFVDDTADTDSDTIPDGIEYAWGFNPKSRSEQGDGFSMDTSQTGAAVPLVKFTFRRDTLATDLTYELQSSGDLAAWTMIARSAAGEAPAGPGFTSEQPSAGAAEFRDVSAQDTPVAGARRYYRLKVVRR